jgi:hypothetical protein
VTETLESNGGRPRFQSSSTDADERETLARFWANALEALKQLLDGEQGTGGTINKPETSDPYIGPRSGPPIPIRPSRPVN